MADAGRPCGLLLAARLAAERIAERVIDLSERRAAQRALADGLKLHPNAPVLAFIQADVAFHIALCRLSGNSAIEDTVAAQWPHFKRSMGVVLEDVSRWKRVIGDGLRSQTDGRQVTEEAVAVGVLNRMLELGRPEYVRIV